MKKLFFLSVLALISTTAFSADEKAKNSEPAIYYSLPKTTLVIEVEATKTTQKAGPYYKYSERYLALKDVVAEDKTSWEVTHVKIVSKSTADKTKTFSITPNTNYLISLNKDGVIEGINLKNTVESEKKRPEVEHKKGEKSTDFFNNVVLTEEQLTANSTAKMAEIAAKQIYRIRENRLSLICGENDKMPADGESMQLMLKNMDKTEKSLVELFAGKTTKTTVTKRFVVDPEKDVKNQILFRLSMINGVVEKDDLSGKPFYINILTTKNETAPANTQKADGLFYTLPGTANVKVSSDEKTFFEKEISVAQLGSVQAIPFKLFDKNTLSVEYNTKTGAIVNMEK